MFLGVLINCTQDKTKASVFVDCVKAIIGYIDNAVASYNDHYGLNNISINEFTKSLIIFLVIQSFRVESVDELNTAPQSQQSQIQ